MTPPHSPRSTRKRKAKVNKKGKANRKGKGKKKKDVTSTTEGVSGKKDNGEAVSEREMV